VKLVAPKEGAARNWRDKKKKGGKRTNERDGDEGYPQTTVKAPDALFAVDDSG